MSRRPSPRALRISVDDQPGNGRRSNIHNFFNEAVQLAQLAQLAQIAQLTQLAQIAQLNAAASARASVEGAYCRGKLSKNFFGVGFNLQTEDAFACADPDDIGCRVQLDFPEPT